MTDNLDQRIRWTRSDRPQPYPDAVRLMSDEAERIASGEAAELIWFLEHPSLLTKGARARDEHLLNAGRFPVFETDRGGELTYHGPGQRIVYTLLDVRRHTGGDIRAFVRLIESSVIGALDRLGVPAWSDPGRPGVWVDRPQRPGGAAKIAAIGLRVRRGISLHGISLNVDPDLEHFSTIVPCGLEETGVTSLAEMVAPTDTETVDNALLESFRTHLGPLIEVANPFR
jgi:lipoyl(octanoyl) transferase